MRFIALHAHAGMLRNLSSYYYKDAPGLHLVRVAQGLLHLGKGLTTIAPYHTDRQLLSSLALASLLTILYCGTDPSSTLCGKHAFMLYYICPAIRPRMLLTLDENGDMLPVSVRVGTAVDTVAQAGQPKSITGALDCGRHLWTLVLDYSQQKVKQRVTRAFVGTSLGREMLVCNRLPGVLELCLRLRLI
jgi:hypothetical protein